MVHNWSHIRNGETVKVYMGSGWQKGTLLSKTKDSATVRLAVGGRLVRVFDPRNVKP